MIKEKVRDLEMMPADTKHKYFKLLFSMALVDGELNQLEVMELYRLMGKNKVLQKERLDLLSIVDTFEVDIIGTCKGLLEDLNDQEKNILRFSLMKDLIIIMEADYYQTSEEIELFSRIKTFFHITEEQMEFFQEEYRKDRNYFEEDVSESIASNRLEERIITAAALGIPIGALYIKKSRRRNDYFSLYRGNKKLSGLDLLKALAIGVVTYEGLKWMFRKKVYRSSQLQQHMYEECMKVQDRAIRYIIKDKGYFQEDLLNLGKENPQIVSLEKKVLLLDKTYAALYNTKPCLL